MADDLSTAARIFSELATRLRILHWEMSILFFHQPKVLQLLRQHREPPRIHQFCRVLLQHLLSQTLLAQEPTANCRPYFPITSPPILGQQIAVEIVPSIQGNVREMYNRAARITVNLRQKLLPESSCVWPTKNSTTFQIEKSKGNC